MEITYLGHAAFRLRQSRGISLVTDPYSKLGEVTMRSVKAEVVTISHSHKDHNDLARVQGEPLVISAPGEYEISGVRVTGFLSFHDKEKGKKRGENTIYLINIDEVNVCHLGDLGHHLEEEVLEEISGVDVLLIPIGGFYTLGWEEAIRLVRDIQPKIVIPMHYKVEGLGEKFASLEEPKNFLENLKAKQRVGEQKINLSANSLPGDPEEMEVVLMDRF